MMAVRKTSGVDVFDIMRMVAQRVVNYSNQFLFCMYMAWRKRQTESPN